MADAIIPLDQAEVDFHGDVVVAVETTVNGDAAVYVPLRPICDNLGLDWSAQRRRTMRDAVLGEEVATVAVTATDGKVRDMIALPLDFLAGWLFQINASRVKEEVRDRLIRYQRECHTILSAYFKTKARGRMDISSLADVKLLGAALIELSTTQEMLQDQVDAHTGILAEAERILVELLHGVDKAHARLNKAGEVVSGVSRRVGRIEQIIDPSEPLTPAMKGKVKSLVDEAAFLLGRTPGYAHTGRRKPYPAIWSEVHRLAGVNSYDEMRQRHYEPIIGELEQWIERLRRWTEETGPDE
jgi:hypothetical protein